MAFLDIFKGIVGPATEAYKAHKDAKTKLALAKIESEIAAELAWKEWRVKNIDADAAWESQSIANSGWKDEFVLLVLSVPLVMVFIPPLTEYVMEGFAVLAETPEWYRWLLVTIYAATFGIRVWRRQIS